MRTLHRSTSTTKDGTPGLPTSLGTQRHGTHGTVLTIHPSTGAWILGTTVDGTVLGTTATSDGIQAGCGMTHGSTADGTTLGTMATAVGTIRGTTVDGMIHGSTADGTADGMAATATITTIMDTATSASAVATVSMRQGTES